ncbi:hypothetical protein ACOTTU_13450 [Roseobacter sp. EG26]|uniref:hypothetical protein n=1 Tax=Roseobacter sp. EG26 TaxID=3412477 RepID=UPI003CE5C48A
MSTTPEILTGPLRVNTTGSAAEPQAVVMGNGNLVVAYISERIGQQTTDAFFARGQQFDFDGNRIGEEALFKFPEETDRESFDIIGLERNLIAILADQDLGGNRDGPFIGVFNISAGGRASFVRGRSENVGGRAVKHFDFALTKRGNNGWMTHSIGRRGTVIFITHDTLRQASNAKDTEVVQGLGARGGSDDDLQSTALANGNIVLLDDHDGDRNAEGRFEARIVSLGGSTIRSVFLGNGGFRNYAGTIQALQGGGFVVAHNEAADRDKDVVFHLFEADGTVVKSFVNVTTTGAIGDNNNEPAIALLGDGGFIIFYDKDTGPVGVRGQCYDSKGIAAGDDFMVAKEDGTRISAHLLDGSRMAVVYRRAGADNIPLVSAKAEMPDTVTIATATGGDDVLTGVGDEDVPDLEAT